MIVRTLTQLNEATEQELQNDENVYSPISKGVNGGFVSKKIKASELAKYNGRKIGERFGLISEGSDLKVIDIKNEVSNIKNGTTTFKGAKTFTTSPISSGTANTNNKLPNKGQVEEMINNKISSQAVFIKPTSPKTGLAVGEDSINPTLETGWKKVILKTSSNQSFSRTDEFSFSKTGNLVVYGWTCADVIPANTQCWIALEAKLSNRWTAIQIKPWIIGDNSTNIQYVGFNAPISKNLELRITAGFKVGSQSNLNTTNSLAGPENMGESEANTFVAYVIE